MIKKWKDRRRKVNKKMKDEADKKEGETVDLWQFEFINYK